MPSAGGLPLNKAVWLADIKSSNIINSTWWEFGCFSMAVESGLMASLLQFGDVNQTCFDLTSVFNGQLVH